MTIVMAGPVVGPIPIPIPIPLGLARCVRQTPETTARLAGTQPTTPTHSLKMGAGLSKALGKLFGNKEMRILMLGLDAAGKTSQSRAPLSIPTKHTRQPTIVPPSRSPLVLNLNLSRRSAMGYRWAGAG